MPMTGTKAIYKQITTYIKYQKNNIAPAKQTIQMTGKPIMKLKGTHS